MRLGPPLSYWCRPGVALDKSAFGWNLERGEKRQTRILCGSSEKYYNQRIQYPITVSIV
jgi:hypothetical protein